MKSFFLFSVCFLYFLQAESFVLFANVPAVFGDWRDPETQDYYTRACRECWLSGEGMSYNHDYACNLYIRCVRFGRDFWLLHGFVAPLGAVFNEHQLHLELMFLQNDVPNTAACDRVQHPCETGMMIPINGDPCSGYMVCVDGKMETRPCVDPITGIIDPTAGFNVMTQSCDLPCIRRVRTELSERCEANPKSDYYFHRWVTVQYSDENSTRVEFFNQRCLLGYKHLDKTSCGCQQFNETVKPCETTTVVHLDTADNSWPLAFNNSAPNDASSLSGNITFVRDAVSNFLNTPRFPARSPLTAPMMRANDLGKFFDWTMVFQSFRTSQQRGLASPGRNESQDVALADNSACETDASYGCRLRWVSDNRARVVCVVNPDTDSKSTNNKEVSSPVLDMTQQVEVYFAKNDTYGVLRVRAGSVQDTQTITFKPHVRALGNECPLSIGAGKDKRIFNGMITKLIIKKYCGPFL